MCEALFVGQNLYAQGVDGGKGGAEGWKPGFYVESAVRGRVDTTGVYVEFEKQVLRITVARTRRRASASRFSPPR